MTLFTSVLFLNKISIPFTNLETLTNIDKHWQILKKKEEDNKIKQ